MWNESIEASAFNIKLEDLFKKVFDTNIRTY